MNKGFTLIELLGVIIIIALLAVIIFPNIINSVKNSSNKTDELTLELIYNASSLYISSHQNDFSKINGKKYTIELKELVDEGYLVSPIKLSDSEEDITDQKCIQVTYNDGYNYELKNTGECQSGFTCTLQDLDANNVASLSDIVTCGTESFYVMNNNNSKITMLSMYNLNVGDSKYPNEKTYGLQDEHVLGYTEGEEGYGGITSFSSTAYWQSAISSYPAYVYSDKSNLYQYVNAYKNYLMGIGVESAEASLISYNQSVELNCNESDCTSAPEWLYSTTYWFGTVNSGENLYYIFSGNTCVETDGYFDTGGFGVRPVITISTTEIK